MSVVSTEARRKRRRRRSSTVIDSSSCSFERESVSQSVSGVEGAGSTPVTASHFSQDDPDAELKAHVLELEELKTSDPEFYAYLVQHDQEALNFGAETTVAEAKGETAASSFAFSSAPSCSSTPSTKTQELTLERFRALLSAATKPNSSFRSCLLFFTAFRCAVRSVPTELSPSLPTSSQQVSELLDVRRAKKNKTQEPRSGAVLKSTTSTTASLPFHIPFAHDDEEEQPGLVTFYTVCIETLQHADTVLSRHCAVAPGSNSATTSSLLRSFPSSCSKRLVQIINTFWTHISFLLQYCYQNPKRAETYQQALLTQLASQRLLRWLVPVRRHILYHVVNPVIRLWLQARCRDSERMENPLAAFLVLRQMFLLLKTKNYQQAVAEYQRDKEKNLDFTIEMRTQEAQQTFLATCQRSLFGLITKVGMTWRSAPGFLLTLQCLVELYAEAPEEVAYRLVFQTLRRIGCCVRQALRARSLGTRTGKSASKTSEPQRLRLRKIEDTSRALYSWAFLMECRFIVALLSSAPNSELSLLVFPFVAVLNSAVTMSLNDQLSSPFVMECLKLQFQLSSRLGVFIPLGSALLTLGDHLADYQNRLAEAERHQAASFGRKKPSCSRFKNPTHVNGPAKAQHQRSQYFHFDAPTAVAAITKPPDLDMTLRLTLKQLSLMQTTEELLERWVHLCIDYYGLVAQHPSFPELIAPVLLNAPRLLRCKSDLARQRMQHFLTLCRTTMTEIYNYRCTVADPLQLPPTLNLCKLETSLSRFRSEVLSEQKQRFKQRLCTESKRTQDVISTNHFNDDDDDEVLELASINRDTPQSTQKASTTNDARSSVYKDAVTPFNFDSDSSDGDSDEPFDDDSGSKDQHNRM